MELRISHRFLVQQLLPETGDAATLRVVRELQSALSFSEEELKAKNIRREGDMFTWGDPEKGKEDAEEVDKPVDIPIGERAFDLIKEVLEQASANKQLELRFLPFFEHFSVGKEWDPYAGS